MSKKVLTIVGVILLLAVLLLSCSKKKEEHSTKTNLQITAAELVTFLVNTNYIAPTKCGIIADKAYMVPTLDWVQTDFYRAFAGFKLSLGTSRWSGEDNDCDDFARFAAFFAEYLHHNTPTRASGTSLAFGEFWYTRDIGGLHAVNVFLYKDKEEIKIGFLEPQNGQILKLSFSEIHSCYYYRF